MLLQPFPANPSPYSGSRARSSSNRGAASMGHQHAGKHDGLAWHTADAKWEGPIGENVATAIDKGYTAGQPDHGYYFMVLTGQGPATPLGEMDSVVEGALIGGFALVAAPAEYAVTGVKTFIVGNDGVVYEKDFGDRTQEAFKKLARFNPDGAWTPVKQ